MSEVWTWFASGGYVMAALAALAALLCFLIFERLLARRAATQPLNVPSCGSVFKNPPGDHAGRLIEAAGLKGTRLGGAQISPLHANFIANLGGATAADVLALVEKARTLVWEKAGVRLEPEVRIIGRTA